ncbi:aTP-dependent Lon protease bacterial type [Clostridium sp. CAG:590]|nr:aTP-dependent Lon protease bacterial type [Clostridium sp. CAG:590]
MPVFDFNQEKKDAVQAEKTYELVYSNERVPDAEHPIMLLEDQDKKLVHHSSGMFTAPTKGTAFIFDEEKSNHNILQIDARFEKLIKWLGENHIMVRLSGSNTDVGYAVYKIFETGVAMRGTKLSGENGFLQFMIERLLQSDAPSQEAVDFDEIEDSDDMKLTSIQSITDYLMCAGSTLPDNIRLWARRNLAVAKSTEVTPEERRHAQRALSIMLNIQWKNTDFQSIDPVEARRILDEELYGLDNVKQRIIETIIQINRTHTLPAYGLLIIGPAGTGKSQIAYAVAKILKMSWTTLEMSSINDPEQLTGSSRIYANAKPGLIMEAFANAESSNLVFIINELDKASSGKGNGNPADVLLTLLDNLGFTDNYVECNIPTTGVYPIATANDRNAISAPLMSRFAVIELPDYSIEEKRVIFTRFAMPKVLKRIGLRSEEIVITDEALNAIMDIFKDTSGIRDIEQAAEHIAANALYRIEVEHMVCVTYDAAMIRSLLQ